MGFILGLALILILVANSSYFQNIAKEIIVKELNGKLNTELGIKKITLRNLRSLQIDSLYILDKENKEIFEAQKISTSISPLALLKGRLIFTEALLSDFNLHINKAAPDSTLNIQFIIDAFASKKDKPSTNKIQLQLNAINIMNGQFTYDVLNKPENEEKFDPNHIHVNDFIAKFSLKSLAKDSLNLQIKTLSLKEAKGLTVENIRGRLISQDHDFKISDFLIQLPHSTLDFDKITFTLGRGSLKDIKRDESLNSDEQNFKFNFILTQSYITPSDLMVFQPSLKNLKEKVSIKTELYGNSDILAMPTLSINFDKRLLLNANAEIKDWYTDSPYISAEVSNLKFSGVEVQDIINGAANKKINLPKYVKDLKNILFVGQVKGELNDIKSKGLLRTDYGSLNIDINLGIGKADKDFTFVKGKINTDKYDLGKTLQNHDLGLISFNINTNIKKKNGNIEGSLNGELDDFYFKGYTYDNIKLQIDKNKEIINLNLDSKDQNAHLHLISSIDLNDKKMPKLDSDLRIVNLDFGKTHLLEKWKDSKMALNLKANLEGSDINDIIGSVNINSIHFERDNQQLEIDYINISSQKTGSGNSEIKLQSDVVSGSLTGKYNFKTLVNDAKKIIQPYLPAFPIYNFHKTSSHNDFYVQLRVENSEQISRVLELPAVVLAPLDLKGRMNSEKKEINVDLDIGLLKNGNNLFKESLVNISTKHDSLLLDVDATIIVKNRVTNTLKIHAAAADDRVKTTIDFENDHLNKIAAQLGINTAFSYDRAQRGLVTDIQIEKSDVIMNNQDWVIEKSDINIIPNLIMIKNFDVHSKIKDESVKINGSYSLKEPGHKLKVDLNHVDLQYVFETLAIDALQFGGFASGELIVQQIDGKPYATSDLTVDNLIFNKAELGSLALRSYLNQETNQIDLRSVITNPTGKKTTLDGYIDPFNQTLSFDIDADDINIAFAKKYTESILNSVTGTGSGKMRMFGNFSRVTLEGYADVKDGKMDIAMLGTEYTFTDKVYFDKDRIHFEKIKFYDSHGNVAEGSGEIWHDFFSDMTYKLDFATDNFLVYNATDKINPIFYGTVFGNGEAILSGDEEQLNINVKMRTNKDSHVYMNFMDDEIADYSFIFFKQKEKPKEEGPVIYIKKEENNKKEMIVHMDAYVDVTPDANFELLMDPVGGDVLKGTGSGTLQFVWNSNRPPELFGIFDIRKGSYNFTFQKLLEKTFFIEEGSTVQFKGDPFKALLDVKAYYRLTASLSDLDNALVKSTGISSIPTNCVLNMSGELQHPEIKLDIEFPTVSSDLASRIKSYMDTEDMINKQITYLLVLSKFYTPENSEIDHPSSDWTVMASATLSNQLTKIINQLDNRVQLGTHIRVSDSELTRTEVELILSSQLLDDRLIINGNFGYRDDPLLYSDAVITDVDIEYLLNKQGTWRLKAYNHFNEKFYYLNNDKGVQTQGIGIIFRKNFNKFSDLFKRKKRKLRVKDEKKEIAKEKPENDKQ